VSLSPAQREHHRHPRQQTPPQVQEPMQSPHGVATPGAQWVAGIDVGSAEKGFHAVALGAGSALRKFWSREPAAVASWCVEIGATMLAVDAPISWSRTGRARAAERALLKAGIHCFFSPSERRALNHPTNHYGWMRNGADLYRALEQHFDRYDGRNGDARPIVFETFPHAIACALAGGIVTARNKRAVRRALLARAGVACDPLTNIDFVDAALCALAAEHFARRQYRALGDLTEGYIVVPSPAR
jgi:predicted nuclease with RNAse H fold